MLAVRRAQILMQHDPVHDRAAAVHAIHDQEHQPGHVARLHHQPPQGEQHDEGDAHRPDVARKALRLALRAEIEEAAQPGAAAAIFKAVSPSGNKDPRRKRQMSTRRSRGKCRPAQQRRNSPKMVSSAPSRFLRPPDLSFCYLRWERWNELPRSI